MKIKLNHNHIKNIFSFIGFIWFMIFIYVAFIRERLPRDIPFNLTEIRCCVLIFICFTYLFLIKQILYPHPLKNNIIQKLLYYIGRPFIFFDSSIKYSKTIYPHYLKFLSNTTVKIKNWSSYDYLTIIYSLLILPRIVLVSIFLVDVFHLNKIEIYYYFIFLGIIPLFYRYYHYSLEFAQEQFIKHLEDLYDKVYLFQVHSSEYYEALAEYENSDILNTAVAPYHEKLVSIRDYFKIQHNNMTDPKETWHYDAAVLAKEEIYVAYRKKHNKFNCKLNQEDDRIIEKAFDDFGPFVQELYSCLDREKNIS